MGEDGHMVVFCSRASIGSHCRCINVNFLETPASSPDLLYSGSNTLSRPAFTVDCMQFPESSEGKIVYADLRPDSAAEKKINIKSRPLTFNTFRFGGQCPSAKS